MAQFDVFRQTFAPDADIPYVIALQSDLLAPLHSVVIAPLKRAGSTPALGWLTPLLMVEGERMVLATTELVSLPIRLLGAPVANLRKDRDQIIAALDMLFTGI